MDVEQIRVMDIVFYVNDRQIKAVLRSVNMVKMGPRGNLKSCWGP